MSAVPSLETSMGSHADLGCLTRRAGSAYQVTIEAGGGTVRASAGDCHPMPSAQGLTTEQVVKKREKEGHAMKLTGRRRIGVLSMEKVVTAVEQTKSADLGIEVNGSSEKGHEVKLSRAGALSAVFGTGEQEQVTAFLSSHCLKVLKPDNASED